MEPLIKNVRVSTVTIMTGKQTCSLADYKDRSVGAHKVICRADPSENGKALDIIQNGYACYAKNRESGLQQCRMQEGERIDIITGNQIILVDDQSKGIHYADSSENGKGLDVVRVGNVYYVKDKYIANGLRQYFLLQGKRRISIKIDRAFIQEKEFFFNRVLEEAVLEVRRWQVAMVSTQRVNTYANLPDELQARGIPPPNETDVRQQLQQDSDTTCSHYINLEKGVKVFISPDNCSGSQKVAELRTQEGNSYSFTFSDYALNSNLFSRNSSFWGEEVSVRNGLCNSLIWRFGPWKGILNSTTYDALCPRW